MTESCCRKHDVSGSKRQWRDARNKTQADSGDTGAAAAKTSAAALAACLPPACLQDVVEIMRQTLDGQLASSGGGGLDCLDFTRGGGGGRAGSQAAERRRFLEALRRLCQVCGHTISVWEADAACRREMPVSSSYSPCMAGTVC